MWFDFCLNLGRALMNPPIKTSCTIYEHACPECSDYLANFETSSYLYNTTLAISRTRSLHTAPRLFQGWGGKKKKK